MRRSLLRSCYALICLVLLVLLAGPATAFDVAVQNAGVWNGECSVLADPADPSHIVVAWMKAGAGVTINVVVSQSHDGGLTWSAPISMPHTDVGWTSADPTLAVGPDGTWYLGFIDFDVRPRGTNGAFDDVARSTTGAASWTAPVAALSAGATPDRPVDRPWLVVDRTNGPLRGRVYLVSKTLNPGPDGLWHVWATSSGDRGLTWSAPHRADPTITGGPLVPAFGMPAIAADGRLWVLFSSIDPSASSPTRLIATAGDDTAHAFTTHVVADLPSSAFFPSDTLQRFTYTLAAHPHDASNVVALWTDARFGDPDIVASRTADGGATWSAPRRVNDDAIGNGVVQDMPWSAFEANGRLAAGWRDRRLGGPGTAAGFDLYGAISADGGASFRANLRVSQSTSPALFTTTGVDFLGVTLADTTLLAAWTSDVTPPYTVHVGGASVAATLLDAPTSSGRHALAIRSRGIARDRIRLALSQPPTVADDFELRDIAGRRHEAEPHSSHGSLELIPRERLAPGLYLVEWRSGTSVAHAKVIVLR